MPKKGTKHKDKVGIVANYHTSRDTPWGDDSYDFWILNGDISYYREKPNVVKWFDLHDWDRANYKPDYLDEVPYLPDTVEHVSIDDFSYRDIMKRYGFFWENSIPMMAAHAGLLDYKYIYLFGLGGSDLLDGMAEMHACLYHTIGMLRMEGRKVYFANYATSEAMGLYGYKDLQKTRIPGGFYFKGAE